MKRDGYFLRKFLDVDIPTNVISRYSQDEQRRIRMTSFIVIIVILNELIYAGIYSLIDYRLFSSAIIFHIISSVIVSCEERGASVDTDDLTSTSSEAFNVANAQ